MVSISIIAFLGWGNILSHGPAPLPPRGGLGELWPGVWSPPCFAWHVWAPDPVHPRFLVRPRLLTRLYPLSAPRATTFFPSVGIEAERLGSVRPSQRPWGSARHERGPLLRCSRLTGRSPASEGRSM